MRMFNLLISKQCARVRRGCTREGSAVRLCVRVLAEELRYGKVQQLGLAVADYWM